jgi:hypothetical protein
MWSSLRAAWIPWCAVVVLALLAASMLHAATPHTAAQRDCPACKALSSPGVAHDTVGPGRPESEPSEFTALPPSGPLSTSTRYLRPLRAPPESPVL